MVDASYPTDSGGERDHTAFSTVSQSVGRSDSQAVRAMASLERNFPKELQPSKDLYPCRTIIPYDSL